MSPANIRIVLVRPTHAGNIGACARAMKNMGLGALCIVQPSAPIDESARAMAAGAEDVLDRAFLAGSVDEALADCALVLGTSARHRRIGWPTLDPDIAAMRLVQEGAGESVALLFGQERTGLTNDELDRCHALVTIPADPGYSSLNLAAAVQILSYEIRKAWLAREERVMPRPAGTRQATHEEMRGFYRHLEQVLVETEFLDPANPRLLMRRLVRLFNRARPDQNDANILRGILTAVQKRWRGGPEKN